MPEQDWTRYQRVVDFLRLRKRAYQFTFGQPHHNEALKDLAKFCRIGTAPWHPDQRKTDILIGRQEVFFRIINHLKLEPDDLYKIYNAPSTIQPKGE
jgi:hypothetical protein